MRRTALIILATAGALTALVLIAVAIAVATVDVRSLVGPVVARVKAETGRDLAFGGPIDLELSLEPRIIATDVTLGNAPWGQAPAMIHAPRVEVQVALLPLLQRRFEVIEVALVEPVIALETDAQGRGNWDFSTPDASGAPATSAATGTSAIAFGNFAVERGSMTFRDGKTGAVTRIAVDHLAVHAHNGNAPIDAEFKGKVDDVAVALTGNLGPLAALRERKWPYPVAIKGEVDGKAASVSTKIGVQGDTTSLDALDFSWGTLAAKGTVQIATAGGRRRYLFDLAIPVSQPADAAVVPGAAAGAPATAPARSAPASAHVIPDRALPLGSLKSFDADGTLAIADVRFDARNRLQSVKLTLALRDGKLDVTSLHAAAYGGTIDGRATIDASRANAPAVAFRIDGRELDLSTILAAAGTPRPLQGGKTTLTVDVNARGVSPHQWASSATGSAMAVVGPTTLVNTKLDLDNAIDKLAQAVNPFRERDPSTELICGVVRLPLADGIAKIDRSIAMETKKIGVSASGTVDFREEKLDLKLEPRLRQGIPIDIPQFAELVRFSGPFTHPAVSIDAVASATTIAKIGAAIGTGGLSMLGTSIMSRVAEGAGPCAVALGSKPAPKPAAGDKPAAQESLPNDIGKAIGKLFGR